MKKSEILSLLDGFADDQDISLVVSGDDDNVHECTLLINILEDYPQELVMQMPEGFFIDYNDGKEEIEYDIIESNQMGVSVADTVSFTFTREQLDNGEDDEIAEEFIANYNEEHAGFSTHFTIQEAGQLR